MTKDKKGIKGKEKKEVVKKGHAEQETIKKLMEETMDKLSNLAGDIVVDQKSKYVGYKFNGRLIASISGKKLSFDFSLHEYSEKGTHTGTEKFEIKSTSKDVSVVITGLLKQVEKNYGFLKEAAKPKKKAEPKKEATKEQKTEEVVTA